MQNLDTLYVVEGECWADSHPKPLLHPVSPTNTWSSFAYSTVSLVHPKRGSGTLSADTGRLHIRAEKQASAMQGW